MVHHQTGSKVCIYVLALAVLVVAKPPPKTDPWASYGKPVFSRSLGPPFGLPPISSITVPYKPKSSPLAPKFVDPTIMITKKMEMLKNLFGGLGPVQAPASSFPKYNSNYVGSSPLLTMSAPNSISDPKQVTQLDDLEVKDKTKRGATSATSKSSKFDAKFNPFFPFGPKVKPFGPKVNPFMPKVNPFVPQINPFVPQVNPFAPQINPFAPKVNPFKVNAFAPKVNPFAAKVNPYGPNYSPYAENFDSSASGYPLQGLPAQQYPSQFYGGDAMTVRRRRSVGEAQGDSTKSLGPPPAYPGLAPIAEEPESPQSKLQKLYGSSTVPRETMPGMFGPFGPFSPYAQFPIDPIMIIAQKQSYMDAFLKNLAATTSPSDVTESDDLAITEIPIPKTTIVPPNFWVPSGIIPAPGEYTAKVTTFLDKLFAHLALNKTSGAMGVDKTVIKRSLMEDPVQGKRLMTKSVEDIRNIAEAKDAIVDSIVSELGDLKGDMVRTLDDYVAYEKTIPTLGSYKKPSKVVSPFAAFFAPPTSDPSVPFKQRMMVLSQVFDMLSGIQTNISLAIREAMMTTGDSGEPQFAMDDENAGISGLSGGYPDPNTAAITAFNATLLDVIRNRLQSLDDAMGGGYGKPVGSRFYSDDGTMVKRDVEVDDDTEKENSEDVKDNAGEPVKREVKMQMHQGYQSMPPGAIETVQAGGGAVPGHQGGGINLLDSQYNDEDFGKWSDYLNDQNEERKHHHSRH